MSGIVAGHPGTTRGPADVEMTEPGRAQKAPGGGMASGGTGASIGVPTSFCCWSSPAVASDAPPSREGSLLSLAHAVKAASSKTGEIVTNACFK
jgi:hypothetical protein